MTETRDAAQPARLEARLRELEAELARRRREDEQLRSSAWFEEILARIWTTF